MPTITDLDLAYGIRFALECGRFDNPADRLRLQHLLTRWDHQQRTRPSDEHADLLREVLSLAIFPSLQLKEQIKALVERWDTSPDAGAGIVRQWTQDREYFLKTFRQIDAAGQRAMAEATVAFHRKHGSDVTVEQQLVAWQNAAQEA